MSKWGDLSREEIACLEKFMLSLYELRLCSIGMYEGDDSEDRKARLWASCALSEAMCVLELTFGVDEATDMGRRMIDRRHEYQGPRYRRMRS